MLTFLQEVIASLLKVVTFVCVVLWWCCVDSSRNTLQYLKYLYYLFCSSFIISPDPTHCSLQSPAPTESIPEAKP